jgi:hypothetical protein
MSLQDFSFPDGSINTLALLEQQCFVQSLYTNSISVCQTLLDNSGGGSVLASAFQPDSWPPSWVLSRQGNTLIVNIAGTTNAQQWAGDVIGVFAVANPFGGGRAHSFFLAAFINLLSAMRPSFPADVATCSWKITGHSYGGAVAFLFSLFALQTFPGVSVQYFGDAAPKALTTGYEGPLPGPGFVIQNGADIFPSVPPNSVLSSITAVVPVVQFAVPWNWTHYLPGVYLQQNGAVTAENPVKTDQPINPTTLTDTANSHYLTSYLVSTSQAVSTFTNSPYARSVQTIAATLIAAPNRQITVTNCGALATVNTAIQNVQTFLGQPGSPLTNSNLPSLVSGTVTLSGVARSNVIFTAQIGGNPMAVKLTFFYTVNNAGFSEVFYSTVPGVPSAFTPAMAIQYLYPRLQISGFDTQIQYLRVAQVGSPRNVTVYPQNAFLISKAGPGGLATPFGGAAGYTGEDARSDFGGTALLIRKVCNSPSNPQTGYSRFFFRGQPDAVVEEGGTFMPNATWSAAFVFYAAAVNALSFSWKASAGLQNPPSPFITAAVQNGDGTVTYTLSAALFTGPQVAAGAKLAVRVTGQVQPAYINGAYTVVVLTATTCRTLRPLPLVNFLAAPPTGRMLLNTTPNYNVINSMIVEKVVKRGPGRPFGLYRGRSKNKLLA